MEIKIEIKKAFKETFIILNELKLYYKLPNEFKKLIEDNMDINYNYSFDKNIPLFNQVNNNITRNLITYIYVTYINNNSNKYFENEIKDILNEKNN